MRFDFGVDRATKVEKPEKKKAPMPGGHDHGGMDGMDF